MVPDTGNVLNDAADLMSAVLENVRKPPWITYLHEVADALQKGLSASLCQEIPPWMNNCIERGRRSEYKAETRLESERTAKIPR